MLTESTLFFCNLTWKSRAKSNVGGRIQNWRMKVSVPQKSAGSNERDSVTTVTQPPPSTFFSQGSRPSSSTSLSAKTCPPQPIKSNQPYSSDGLVGAFGDDDIDNLSDECNIAAFTKGNLSSRTQVSVNS